MKFILDNKDPIKILVVSCLDNTIFNVSKILLLRVPIRLNQKLTHPNKKYG
jgi:hypothetical protein